jgi:hypothetical protein
VNKPAVTQKRRDEILGVLSRTTKIPLTRVVKYSGDDPRYRLETQLGNIQLGNVNGLIAQNKLRSSIAAATGKYLRHFEADEWPPIAQLLLEACEEVERGQDATLAGMMSVWLRAYLRDKPPHETLEEADEGREPFQQGDGVFVFADNLRQWLGVQQGERLPRNVLTADLRAFGAKPEQFELDVKGKRTTRSAWRIPAGLCDTDPKSGLNTNHPL